MAITWVWLKVIDHPKLMVSHKIWPAWCGLVAWYPTFEPNLSGGGQQSSFDSCLVYKGAPFARPNSGAIFLGRGARGSAMGSQPWLYMVVKHQCLNIINHEWPNDNDISSSFYGWVPNDWWKIVIVKRRNPLVIGYPILRHGNIHKLWLSIVLQIYQFDC